jgi:hypothetical protein
LALVTILIQEHLDLKKKEIRYSHHFEKEEGMRKRSTWKARVHYKWTTVMSMEWKSGG